MKTVPLGDLLEVLCVFDYEDIYLSFRLDQKDAPCFTVQEIEDSMDINNIRVKTVNLYGVTSTRYNEFVIDDWENVVTTLMAAKNKRANDDDEN